MTLAEMLIVVAIIGVLGGVAFVAVWNYQRSMGQLERDGIAKEIFVAAQNHLTAAYGEGYFGLSDSDFGTEDTSSIDGDGNAIVGDYYYMVNGGATVAGVFDQMLPFGSVDETVRAGGSYIIHYQKDSGLVLDVFYCTRNGSPTRFNVDSLETGDYSLAMSARESKDNRRTGAWRNESNGSILGYYGGTDAASLPTATLQSPTIKVVNAEKLYVEVTDPNKDVKNEEGYQIAALKLIITGVDSRAQKAYVLQFPASGRVETKDLGSSYTVILDDITTSGMHFGEIDADTTEKFIPGEDIEIQAVAYSTEALTNIAYSAKSTTNSLFGSINSGKDTAYIGNIRHLENLDKDVSNLDANDGTGENDKLKITHAEQVDNFSWETFQKEIINIETNQPRGTAQSSGYSQEIYKYNSSSPATAEGYYLPISPNYALTYDGQSHSISHVAVSLTGENGYAGLFGSTSSVTEIKNTELIDFSISGTTSAGALAGTLGSSCTVTNVLARNSTNSTTSTITASSGPAGGLIGDMSGTVQYSAAAVIVNGSTTAGGLVGTSSGSITGCYSGGHTTSGSYSKWGTTTTGGVTSKTLYDVTGGTAGGLVGTYTGSKIENSYSTCSVSGTTAGGFAGNAGGSIENCYSTGLVDGTTKYAFLGSGTASLSGNYYYRVINEVEKTESGKTVTVPMEPYPSAGEVSSHLSSVKPIDLNAGSYNTFVGAWDDWNPARAYDSALVQYYSGRYCLETVDELNSALPTGYENWNQLFVKTHYGDWPSPEVFFINES